MKKSKRNTFTLPIELSIELDFISKKLRLKKSNIVKKSLISFFKKVNHEPYNNQIQ